MQTFLHGRDLIGDLDFSKEVKTEQSFTKGPNREKLEKLDKAMDDIKKRFGDGAIVRGSSLIKEKQSLSAQEE